MPQDTLLIIPAYNEGESIFKVVSAVKDLYDGLPVVVINDGSTDDTSAEAARAGALVLDHPFNMGYGVAIQTGYKYARRNGFDYLIQMDGDGQHDPENIQTLLHAVKSGDCELALGSRFLDSIEYRSSFFRYAGVVFLRGLIRTLTGKTITDPTSGFQAMTRNVFTLFSRDFFPTDFPDADIITLLSKLNMRIKEIPVRMHPSTGRSLHRPYNIIYYFFKQMLATLLTMLRGHCSYSRDGS